MPRIQTYDSQVREQGPIQYQGPSGAPSQGEGMLQLASAASQVGQQLYQRQEQTEVSDLNAKMAGAHAEFTTKLKDLAKDPNSIGKKDFTESFVKQYDDFVAKLSEGVSTRGGRVYLDRAASENKAHFYESAAATQAHLAGVKAVEDHTNSMNAWTSSLLNDPSSYQFLAKQHDNNLASLVSSGSLPAEKAAELRLRDQSELAKATVYGWAKLDTKLAKSKLDAGEFDSVFDGDTKRQMYGVVAQEEAAKRAEIELQRREQERLLDKKRESFQTDLITNIYNEKMTTSQAVRAIVDAKFLKPVEGSGSQASLIGMVQRIADEKNKPDPAVFNDLVRRIHLPDGDPNKITSQDQFIPYVGRGIDLSSMNQLRSEFEGDNTEEGKVYSELKKGIIKQAESQYLQKDFAGNTSARGQEMMQKFTSFVFQRLAEERKSGTPVMDLLTPGSPKYLGRYLRAEGFNMTAKDLMDEAVQNMGGAGPLQGPPEPGRLGRSTPVSAPASPLLQEAAPTPPPETDPKARIPGEPAGVYLKRIGKK